MNFINQFTRKSWGSHNGTGWSLALARTRSFPTPWSGTRSKSTSCARCAATTRWWMGWLKKTCEFVDLSTRMYMILHLYILYIYIYTPIQICTYIYINMYIYIYYQTGSGPLPPEHHACSAGPGHTVAHTFPPPRSHTRSSLRPAMAQA